MKVTAVTLAILIGFIAIAVGGAVGVAVVAAGGLAYYMLIDRQATSFHDGLTPLVHAAFVKLVSARAERAALSQQAWELLRTDKFRDETTRLAHQARGSAETAHMTFADLVMRMQLSGLSFLLIESTRLPAIGPNSDSTSTEALAHDFQDAVVTGLLGAEFHGLREFVPCPHNDLVRSFLAAYPEALLITVHPAAELALVRGVASDGGTYPPFATCGDPARLLFKRVAAVHLLAAEPVVPVRAAELPVAPVVPVQAAAELPVAAVVPVQAAELAVASTPSTPAVAALDVTRAQLATAESEAVELRAQLARQAADHAAARVAYERRIKDRDALLAKHEARIVEFEASEVAELRAQLARQLVSCR